MILICRKFTFMLGKQMSEFVSPPLPQQSELTRKKTVPTIPKTDLLLPLEISYGIIPMI